MLRAPLAVNDIQIGYVQARRLSPDGPMPAGSGDTVCQYEWRVNINGVTTSSIEPLAHRYGDGAWALIARVIEAAGRMPNEFSTEPCRSCQAPVIWAETEAGKAMPVDADPVPDGTVALEARYPQPPLAQIGRPRRDGRTDLRKSHFAAGARRGAHRDRRRLHLARRPGRHRRRGPRVHRPLREHRTAATTKARETHMNLAALIGIVTLAAAAIPSLVLAGLLSADAGKSAVERDIARLTAPYAPPRQDLTGEQQPVVRRTPGQALAAQGYTTTTAATPADQPPAPAVLERVLAGLQGLDSERVANEYVGRHRWGTAEGSCAQVARMRALRIPTDQWQALVAPLTAGWCDSCSPGRERERPHQSCPGCPCPCRHPQMLIGQPGMQLVS